MGFEEVGLIGNGLVFTDEAALRLRSGWMDEVLKLSGSELTRSSRIRFMRWVPSEWGDSGAVWFRRESIFGNTKSFLPEGSVIPVSYELCMNGGKK